MAYIEGSFPPLKVWVRTEYMYQGRKQDEPLQAGVIVSVRCLPGQVALFQVLLDNGVLRDKLPSSALQTAPVLPVPEWPFHYLQLWNCFSHNFSVTTISYLSGLQVDVVMKDRRLVRGSYYTTINWGSVPDQDFTLAEDPMEHKSHHVILLENGQIALQPNNRLRWYEPSFVTKPFPSRPDYLANDREWNAEGHGRWLTSDDNKYFYDVEETTRSDDQPGVPDRDGAPDTGAPPVPR